MTSADTDALPALSSATAELERLARERGEETVAAAARELAHKIEQNHFYLVVVGQFKRGKTSLLNALLGEAILPVAVLPLTSVVTILRYGGSPSASVHFESGAPISVGLDRLADYVTESGNPRNIRRVGHVEVLYPSPHLQAGLTLADTPGIASVYAHNTQVTYGFLPRIDAAVFVTSPEPPLTAAEVEFLEDLRKQVSKIFVVMNKADLVEPSQLAEVMQFTKQSLPAGLTEENTPLLPVSSRLALEAKLTRDAALLGASGLAGFEAELRRFLRDEKSAVFLHSIARSLLRLIAELRMYLSLRVRAVQMPVEELRAKIVEFEEQLGSARQQQEDNDLLLKGSLAKLSAAFEEQARGFAESQVTGMSEAVRRFLEQSRTLPRRQLAGAADRFIADRVREAFDTWRIEFESSAVGSFREATTRFQTTVNALARKVRETAGNLFSVAIADLEMNEDLVYVEPTGYYTDTLLGWGLGNAPFLLPGGLYRRYLLRKALKRVPNELERNATRVAYDFKRRLTESVSRFQRDLNRKLSDTTDSISHAMRTALERQELGAQESELLEGEVGASLEALDGLRSGVTCESYRLVCDGGA
jgi:small GTP-binding protein